MKNRLGEEIEEAAKSSVYKLKDRIDPNALGMLIWSLIIPMWPAYAFVTGPILLALSAKPLIISYSLLSEINN